jgi:cellulose biosynthesis protein BcsQ
VISARYRDPRLPGEECGSPLYGVRATFEIDVLARQRLHGGQLRRHARHESHPERDRLPTALREAERDFDLIVIDTAPILLVPDAIPLLSQVGGVVVVGRLRKTQRVALARLKEQLDAVAAPTLGAVVNSVGKDTAYGSGYHDRRK